MNIGTLLGGSLHEKPVLWLQDLKNGNVGRDSILQRIRGKHEI